MENKILGQITGTTASTNMWDYPIRIEINEYSDSIEMIYKETSRFQLTIYAPQTTHERVFKIIFSCINGKWVKSERIYGKIIPLKNESYNFDSLS